MKLPCGRVPHPVRLQRLVGRLVIKQTVSPPYRPTVVPRVVFEVHPEAAIPGAAQAANQRTDHRQTATTEAAVDLDDPTAQPVRAHGVNRALRNHRGVAAKIPPPPGVLDREEEAETEGRQAGENLRTIGTVPGANRMIRQETVRPSARWTCSVVVVRQPPGLR